MGFFWKHVKHKKSIMRIFKWDASFLFYWISGESCLVEGESVLVTSSHKCMHVTRMSSSFTSFGLQSYQKSLQVHVKYWMGPDQWINILKYAITCIPCGWASSNQIHCLHGEGKSTGSSLHVALWWFHVLSCSVIAIWSIKVLIMSSQVWHCYKYNIGCHSKDGMKGSKLNWGSGWN